MITKSLLQLERCLLTRLHIETRECPNLGPGIEVSENLDIQFTVRPHKTEPKFLIAMTLTVTWPPDIPSCYERLEITLESVFAFPVGTSEDEIRQYVPVLCLSNLLGIARGMIAQSTSLCPGGSYLLSLVNMQELLKKHAEREQVAVEVSSEEIVPQSQRRIRRKKVTQQDAE